KGGPPGRWGDRSSEIECEVKQAEAIEDLFALADKFEVVSNIRQLVFPVAGIIWPVGHFARVKAIGQFHELFPLGEAGSQAALGILESAAVSGSIKPRKVQGSTLFVRVVTSQMCKDLEIRPRAVPFMMLALNVRRSLTYGLDDAVSDVLEKVGCAGCCLFG